MTAGCSPVATRAAVGPRTSFVRSGSIRSPSTEFLCKPTVKASEMVERAKNQDLLPSQRGGVEVPSEVEVFFDACEAHGLLVERSSFPDTSLDVVEYARVSCPAESHGGDRDDANVSVSYAYSTGTLLLTCHSWHCRFEEILAGVGMLDPSRVAAGERVESGPATVAQWTLDRGIDFERTVDIVNPKRYKWGTRKKHTFLYTDVSGDHELQKKRTDHTDGKKTFVWQRRVDGEWVDGLAGLVPQVFDIRQLDAIREDGWVFVVEGEKSVRYLLADEYPALCLPSGANVKWVDEYDDVFRGLKVIVVADRDGPGMKYAMGVSEQLQRLEVDHVVVQSATLGEGDDVVEHLAAGHNMSELVVVELPPHPTREDAVPVHQGRPTQAQQLVALALRLFRLGVSTDDRVFAVRLDGPAIAVPFRGPMGFRNALANAHYRQSGKVPCSSAITDALNVLEARARECPPERVSIRIARDESGGVFVDLGDSSGQVVHLGESGWHLLDHSPTLFRRTELTTALPEPERGADLVDGLSALLNIEARSMPLLVAWLVACFLDIPVPIARLTGEQGTGKSTAARILTRLVDPSPALLRSPPRDIAEWAVTAVASHVCTFDNVSFISSWFSDALCQTVTGGAVLRRALYTDDSLSVISLRRPVLLTSIDHSSVRGDLADRFVTVNLQPIPETARRDDAEIEQRFLDAWSGLIGGLYDITVKVLAELPTISLPYRPRMADYAAVLAAVDAVLGTEGLDEYLESRAGLAAEVVASDTVAEAIVAFLDEIDTGGDTLDMTGELMDGAWQGTATSLLNHLSPDRPPRGWPTTSQALSSRLRRLAPDLRTVGITITFDRFGAGGKRFIRIQRSPTVTLDRTGE
jgi:hypothetical protein